jgi:hypothetical protein
MANPWEHWLYAQQRCDHHHYITSNISDSSQQIERALVMWKMGKVPQKAERASFLENPWASRAAAYLVKIKQVAQSEIKWSEVYSGAAQMIDPNMFDDTLDDNPTDGDPRTLIYVSD